MTKREILHKILEGMDPYVSCGVPDVYWDLAVELTRELYGEKGVKLLEDCHYLYEDGDNKLLHTVHGWAGGGELEILPADLIEKLKALNKESRNAKT